MAEPSEQAKKFYKKYDIKVLDDSRRVAYPPRFNMFDVDPKSHTSIPMTHDSEPLLTVAIPASRLKTLIDIENIFFGNSDAIERRQLFERWFDQFNKEAKMRSKFPAIAQAYNHYLALLEWCGCSGRKITDFPPE